MQEPTQHGQKTQLQNSKSQLFVGRVSLITDYAFVHVYAIALDQGNSGFNGSELK